MNVELCTDIVIQVIVTFFSDTMYFQNYFTTFIYIQIIKYKILISSLF